MVELKLCGLGSVTFGVRSGIRRRLVSTRSKTVEELLSKIVAMLEDQHLRQEELMLKSEKLTAQCDTVHCLPSWRNCLIMFVDWRKPWRSKLADPWHLQVGNWDDGGAEGRGGAEESKVRGTSRNRRSMAGRHRVYAHTRLGGCNRSSQLGLRGGWTNGGSR